LKIIKTTSTFKKVGPKITTDVGKIWP
jgi:hypothetical protein